MADPFTNSLLSGLSPEAFLVIFILALIIGLVLVFAGELIWKPLMSVIGGFIGATLGFAIGTLLIGGVFGGLILATIGGLVGSLLFAAIVEFALAALAGIMAFVIILLITASFILAAVVGIVVLILCLIFIKEVIGIVMAIIGSLIVGVALTGLGFDIGLAAIVALILMVVGSLIQTFAMAGRRRAQHPDTCPDCRGTMVYDQYGKRWYCPNCGASTPPPPPSN